jgi:predicted anti-sigma-YlaC factor YlaD
MNHLSEEQIVLHFYGDAEPEEDVRRHLAECSACREEFERIQELLRGIEPLEVPEPPAVFEDKTWLNVRDRLPERRGLGLWLLRPPKWALAGVMAVLLAAAFMAGRFWPKQGPSDSAKNNVANPQRVILVAVGGHLERSQMLLVELMNAGGKGPLDLSTEQQQARDLLDANHLYRLSAQRAGDRQVAHLLDDLGRVLAEIANAPAEASPDDLRQIRSQIQSDNLLFKVRVIGSEVNSRVRRQEQNPGAGATQRL